MFSTAFIVGILFALPGMFFNITGRKGLAKFLFVCGIIVVLAILTSGIWLPMLGEAVREAINAWFTDKLGISIF